MSLQQKTEEFIGRKHELDIFEHWLENASIPCLLYFYDALEEIDKKGGIGKTRLLRQCARIIEERYPNIVPVFIDFFNVSDRSGIAIAERVVLELHKRYPNWSAESFEKALNEYHLAANRKKSDMSDVRERLGDALIADLLLLHEQMKESNAYIVVFFDTFELIEDNPITAVLRPYQTFPDNYYFDRIAFVMAGRNPINWAHQNWIERANDVQPVPLSPFTFKEAIYYLGDKADLFDIASVSEEHLQVIYNNTEGRPILLGLVADILNQQGQNSLEQLIKISKPAFEASLVLQINNFPDPTKWAIFFMAHIYHRFDATLLDLIMQKPALRGRLPEIEYRQLVESLPTLSFVRPSGSSDNFVLHDEMRRLVTKHCWNQQDVDGRMRRELSVVAIGYYETHLAHEVDEHQRHSYTVEMLFHKLVVDPNEGYHFFEQHFNRAIDLSMRAFARSLLQEAKKFVNELSHNRRLDLKMAEARLLQEEEEPSAAIEIYHSLESEASWAEDYRADILYQKGNCYEQTSQLSEAIACFTTALEIEQSQGNKSRCAEILGQLGYIHRRLGHYSEAMNYYDESIELLKNLDNPQEYATMLNNKSNIYRLQGQIEEALRFCKLGWRIRRDLFKRGEVSELDVGLSLNTMGLIYKTRDEVIAAERRFQEAFEIYNRVGYKKGIAAIYNLLGQLLLPGKDLDEALKYFEQAHRISNGIDQEACIDSLSGQGKVFALQGKYEKAIEYFEQARDLARQVGASYRQVENLLALAESLEQLGQPADRILKEAKQIAAKNNYYLLLGLAEEIQGDFEYKAERYRNAFKHYRVTCKYFAQYNPVQFQKFLRRLVDLLLDMPEPLLLSMVDLLLDYWFDLKLDKTYPALLDTCKEVRKYMSFGY